MGWKEGHPGRPGEKNAMSRLTADDIREIRRIRKGMTHPGVPADDPRSLDSIAERYGISRGHVSAIVKRKVWAHLP